jgi:hypothetical protein
MTARIIYDDMQDSHRRLLNLRRPQRVIVDNPYLGWPHLDRRKLSELNLDVSYL